MRAPSRDARRAAHGPHPCDQRRLAGAKAASAAAGPRGLGRGAALRCAARARQVCGRRRAGAPRRGLWVRPAAGAGSVLRGAAEDVGLHAGARGGPPQRHHQQPGRYRLRRHCQPGAPAPATRPQPPRLPPKQRVRSLRAALLHGRSPGARPPAALPPVGRRRLCGAAGSAGASSAPASRGTRGRACCS